MQVEIDSSEFSFPCESIPGMHSAVVRLAVTVEVRRALTKRIARTAHADPGSRIAGTISRTASLCAPSVTQTRKIYEFRLRRPRVLAVIHIFLRPQRACPVGEGDGVAKRVNRENTDPHVLVTWVKEIRRLCGRIGERVHLLHHPDEPDGVGYCFGIVPSRSILFTIRAKRMGSSQLCIATRHGLARDICFCGRRRSSTLRVEQTRLRESCCGRHSGNVLFCTPYVGRLAEFSLCHWSTRMFRLHYVKEPARHGRWKRPSGNGCFLAIFLVGLWMTPSPAVARRRSGGAEKRPVCRASRRLSHVPHSRHGHDP